MGKALQAVGIVLQEDDMLSAGRNLLPSFLLRETIVNTQYCKSLVEISDRSKLTS